MYLFQQDLEIYVSCEDNILFLKTHYLYTLIILVGEVFNQGETNYRAYQERV